MAGDVPRSLSRLRPAVSDRNHHSLNRTFIILILLALSGAVIATTSAGMFAAIIIVLILAFAKGWFVILDFMEMRGTDGLLKPALLAWPATLLALALGRSILARILF
ncbi:cytochrome C oxidase subunit IV family protein [Brucella oryzae]|uniref:cytochrome C oxidase subunit IV family protein n=1 Tax=Brucella oryzae TaxID=335286 RepID=UPI003D15FC05